MKLIFLYLNKMLIIEVKMAAQKLTKKRLLQLILMLVILGSAFVYRTYTYTG